MNSKSTGKKIAMGTIFALVVGYIVGILTAPKSGKETRQDIKDASNKAMRQAELKVKELYADLSEAMDQLASKAKDFKGKSREKLDDLMASGKDARGKLKEVLSAIRHGDADDPQLRDAVKQATEAKNNLMEYLKKSDKK